MQEFKVNQPEKLPSNIKNLLIYPFVKLLFKTSTSVIVLSERNAVEIPHDLFNSSIFSKVQKEPK